MLTALGIEVSFVTYIEQTVYNRSFRHDVLKRLTFNTVIDCISLTLLAVVAGLAGFWWPYRFPIAILITIFTAVDIPFFFLSMYFLTNETDPFKQAKFFGKRYFFYLDNFGKDRAFDEWVDLRSIFEDCLSEGEYHFCERIAISWMISVYHYIESHPVAGKSDKEKAAILDKEKDLSSSFFFFLSFDFGDSGLDSLMRILHHVHWTAACLKMDGFDEVAKNAEQAIFSFFRNSISDENNLCFLFRSFFLVSPDDKRSDFSWSKKDKEVPGEFVREKERIVFDVSDHLLFDGQGNNASLISSTLVQDLPNSLLKLEPSLYSQAFDLYVGVLLGFVNSPFPEGSDVSIQNYFGEITKNNDEPKIKDYIDRFLLADDLRYKCLRDMPFADLVLNHMDRALLLGYKTKELFEKYFELANDIVFSERGVVSADIIPSNPNLSKIIDSGAVKVDEFTDKLMTLFLSSAFGEKTSYIERILSCVDSFIFESGFNFDEKNPYYVFYVLLLKNPQQSDRDIARKIIAHFEADIVKADKAGQLTGKTLDDLCEEIETSILWKATSNIEESIDLAWFLRNFVEKDKILPLCSSSEKAARIVYDHISMCGETAIEDGRKEILQIMSAALGWGAIWEHSERKRTDLSGFILKRGVRLFVLSLNVSGDCSASVFVGTLVIVNGAYAVKVKNQDAFNTIVSQLKESRWDVLPILQKSMDLRKNQSSWDDLFGEDAGEWFNEFWKKLSLALPEKE